MNGRLAFTTEEIVGALGKSVPAVRAQLRRPKDKGRIADPFRGFHVVVPAKYRRLGCLPADQFVPQLMAHLSQPCYVAGARGALDGLAGCAGSPQLYHRRDSTPSATPVCSAPQASGVRWSCLKRPTTTRRNRTSNLPMALNRARIAQVGAHGPS